MSGALESPLLPLVAYTDALCAGARVLFVGDARSRIAERLVERGARLVHVCDHVAARRAEAAQSIVDRAITFGGLNDGSFALREAFFDLALVENLAAHSDWKAVVAQVARLLAPRGTAFVVSPNPEAARPLLSGADASGRSLDYYALYDVVAAEFRRVRMLGQVPFVGYAVVDFATEGEPAVVFDASLVSNRGEEPDYFVAVAGAEHTPLDAYAVIQLPSGAVLEKVLEKSPAVPVVPARLGPAPALAPAPAPAPAPARPTPDARDVERRRLEAWIGELEARAAAADERADAAEGELDEVRERHGNLEQARRREVELLVSERDGLKSELERHLRQKHDLGERLQAAQAATAAAATATQAAQAKVQAAQAEAQAAQAEAQAAQAKVQAVQAEAQAAQAEAQAAQAEAQTLREKVAGLGDDGLDTEDLKRLEAQLAERGEHIRVLERGMREAERTGRELARKLERSSPAEPRAAAVEAPVPAPTPAEPPGLMPAAAVRLAELEAERVVLNWALQIARGERRPDAPGPA